MELEERLEKLRTASADLGVELPAAPNQLSEPSVLLVVGSIKAGKSSLTNDLVGVDLLPDDRPVTDSRVYARLSPSLEQAAKLAYRTGEGVQVELDDAQRLLSKRGGDDGRLPMLDRVELKADTPFLNGFSVEDSPGLDDAKAGGAYVRDDILERAFDSSGVLYVIAGRVLPTASDAARLRWLTDNGVPWVITISRWDEVDEYEDEDEDPAEARLRSLREWGVSCRPEQVHFTSSWEYRQHGTGGVAELSAALARIMGQRGRLEEARRCRRIGRGAEAVRESVEHWLESRLASGGAEADRQEVRQARKAAGHVRTLNAAFAELRAQLVRRVDATVREIRVECAKAKPDETLDEVWSEKYGPALVSAWKAAVRSFNDGLLMVSEATEPEYRPLEAPGMPAVVFRSFDSFTDVEALADAVEDKAGEGVGQAVTRLGKKVMAWMRREAWTSETVAAVQDGCWSEIEPTLAAAQRRCDLMSSGIEDAAAATQEDAAESLAAEVRRGERLIRQLAALSADAQLQARVLSTP